MKFNNIIGINSSFYTIKHASTTSILETELRRFNMLHGLKSYERKI